MHVDVAYVVVFGLTETVNRLTVYKVLTINRLISVQLTVLENMIKLSQFGANLSQFDPVLWVNLYQNWIFVFPLKLAP